MNHLTSVSYPLRSVVAYPATRQGNDTLILKQPDGTEKQIKAPQTQQHYTSKQGKGTYVVYNTYTKALTVYHEDIAFFKELKDSVQKLENVCNQLVQPNAFVTAQGPATPSPQLIQAIQQAVVSLKQLEQN